MVNATLARCLATGSSAITARVAFSGNGLRAAVPVTAGWPQVVFCRVPAASVFGEMSCIGQDIAKRLGVYRETATYALNQLRSAGAVLIARRHIRILDSAQLERLAAGT